MGNQLFEPDQDFRKVSLTTVNNGAAVELFDYELKRLLANIADERTETKQARKIILEVTLLPSEARDAGTVTIKCSSKLAVMKARASSVYLRQSGKETIALESTDVEGSLFPLDGPESRPQ